MKKLVLSAIAATALLTAVAVPAVIGPQSALARPDAHCEAADINHDGIVNMEDLVIAANHGQGQVKIVVDCFMQVP